MNSTPKLKATGATNGLISLADEGLAHAYEQITRADEELGRVNEQLSKLEHDARDPSAVLGRRPSRGGQAQRGFIGLLLAACIFVAAFVSQSSYGDATRPFIARWVPQLIPTPSLSPEKARLPAQLVQAAAPESVQPQSTPSAQAGPQDVPPTAAPVPPELSQVVQTMAQDLARVEQGVEQLKASQSQMASDNGKVVEQLKASQAQMASDNAKAVEQLKASQAQMASDNAKLVEQLNASQEQITRLIARINEQNLRPKTSTSPPSPIATPARKPAPTLPQAGAHRQTPRQLQPQ
jgi:uncharacterized protein YgiM (DUF1202 family)